jgi:hypothetical protein
MYALLGTVTCFSLSRQLRQLGATADFRHAEGQSHDASEWIPSNHPRSLGILGNTPLVCSHKLHGELPDLARVAALPEAVCSTASVRRFSWVSGGLGGLPI